MPIEFLRFIDIGPFTIPDNATLSRVISLGNMLTWARVTNVSIGLTDLSHTFPSDLDFLLVGPNGTNLEFWSDAGFNVDLVNARVTIMDSAATSLPNLSAIVNGFYKPTDYEIPAETNSNWSG